MWPNTQFPADLVTFTEAILNGKLHLFVQSIKCRFTIVQSGIVSKIYKVRTIVLKKANHKDLC